MFEFLSLIERIEINPDTKARVVINEKTGTVIIGNLVKISPIAISHGTLSIKVSDPKSKVKKKTVNVIDGTTVGDLVNHLNILGVTPKDLITILQSIKAAGGLHGDLEIL